MTRVSATKAHSRVKEEILRRKKESEVRGGPVHVSISYSDMFLRDIASEVTSE